MNGTRQSPDLTALDAHRQQAVMELMSLIQAKYPSTTFTLRAGIDDPEATYLTATVNVEDPDDVLESVIDRLLELQLEQHLPIYVLPIHTPERLAETMRHQYGRHTALLSSGTRRQ